MSAEDYDVRQNSIWNEQDDLDHSSQRRKGRRYVNWDIVKRDKERLMKKAEKRGTTLGKIYEDLDQKYLNQILLQGLVKRPIKKQKK